MTVYLGVLGLLALAGVSRWALQSQYGERRLRRPSTVALVGVLTAVAALRWRVGTDYENYAALYPQYISMPFSEMGFANEPGIAVIAKMAAIVYDDYTAMFAIASIVTVATCTIVIIRRSTSPMLGLVLFILTGAWQASFNGVRQWLACAVVFAAHHFILDRRFVPYLGMVTLASLFHISAIVTILFYFIPRRAMGLWGTLLLASGTFAMARSYGRLAEAVTAVRDMPLNLSTSAYFSEQISPLRILAAAGPLLLYLFVTNKAALSEASRFYANMSFIYMAVIVASYNSAYIARFAAYPQVFLALAVPALLNMRDPRSRTVWTGLVLTCYAAFWYAETTVSPSSSSFRWVFDR